MKHKIINGVDRNDLVFMKLSLSESQEKLKWEHSKEFEYNGEMYDVVNKRIEGDSILFWLWWDNKETLLNKKLDRSFAGIWENNDKNKRQKKYLVDFSKTLFFETPFSLQFSRCYSIDKLGCVFAFSLPHLSLDTPSPPPKHIG